MSAIANFKKRRLAAKAKQGDQQAKPVTALALLATLLGCDESKAIETAQQYVDQNIKFFCEDDLPALHVDSEKEQVDVSPVEDTTDELNTSIDSASNAADEIESAADKASDAATDLAYQADDINAANSDLKDTVEELKKPSAAQESSNSKSKTEPKKSSKK